VVDVGDDAEIANVFYLSHNPNYFF